MAQSAFGSYMRELRIKRGLTQIKLAEELGVSHATISRLERGLKTPTSTEYERIMQTFGVYSGDYLTVFLTREQIEQNNFISELRCALRDGRHGDAKRLMQSSKDKSSHF